MEFLPDNCFDVIIDKALLDSLLCSTTNSKDVSVYIREMHRVLKHGGKFIIISHGKPESSRLECIRRSLITLDNKNSTWGNIEYKNICKFLCRFVDVLLLT